MKRTKLPLLLALIMCFEMMIAPVAQAQSMLEVINMVGNTYNQTAQQGPGIPSAQYGSDMQALSAQQAPGQDKYFTPQNLSRLPDLGQYLALNGISPNALNCATLPTTFHEAKNEVCRIGITNDRGVNPAAQLSEMFAYFNQYTQIDKLYRNYSAQSNAEGQQFGVGCMKNAQQILNGYFNYRVNELDKLSTNMEALNNQFREASRSDLNAIEESTAVLEGSGGGDLADTVRTRRPDLFDFGKRFNNPACISMFSADKLNEEGVGGGLNRINKVLKQTLNTPDQGSRYSGSSYTAAHGNVIADLNALADKVGKQAELNFSAISGSEQGYAGFLRSLPSAVSSTTGTSNALSPDLFSDVQTRFSENNGKLATEANMISNEMRSAGVNPENAMNLLRSTNPANFENEVATMQNQMKNACLSRSLSGTSSLSSVLDKIYDPNGSKFANENTANFLKEKLTQILQNNETSPEKKLAELRSLEAQAGSRFLIRLGTSYEVQDVDAAGKQTTKMQGANKRTPASYFSDVIRNCEAQFKVNKLGNTMSGGQAIQRIRKLQQDYKSLAASHAQEIRSEIRKKMIECSDQVSNITTGSCDSSRFNTTAPGFCAATAISCSQNMQACTQQAQGFVNTIKAERTARVGNYKALAQKNKQDIVRIFDTALAKYMRDGEAIRGLFGAGFTPPANVEREVPEGQRYLSSFQQATANSEDGRLLLEDPDKYLDMLKRNIANLRKNVKEQQDQILGGNGSTGILAEHIKQTERNFTAVATQAKTMADACIGKHDEFVRAQEQERQRLAKEEADRQKELGEKRDEICSLYTRAQSDADGACSQNVTELTAGVRDIYSNFQSQCAQGGFNNQNGSSNSNSNEGSRNVADVCRTRLGGTIPSEMPTDVADVESRLRYLCNSKHPSTCPTVAQTPVNGTPTPGTAPQVTDTGCREDRQNAIIAEDRASRLIAQTGGNGGARSTFSTPPQCVSQDNSGRWTPQNMNTASTGPRAPAAGGTAQGQ